MRIRSVSALAGLLPLVFVAFLISARMAQAQSCAPAEGGPPCEFSAGPASRGEPDPVDLSVGNPFHPLTGNKYQEEVDAAPEPGELGLEIRRHYNARHVAADAPAGRGWQLSYDTRLYRVGSTAQIIQADGRRVIFDLGAAVADGGRRLCQHPSALQGQLWVEADDSGYVWRWPEGRELVFDAAGLLIAVHGSGVAQGVLRLRRDDAGRLIEATDPAGRSMRLWHDVRGHLQRIEHPRGVWAYQVSAAGQMQRVTSPNGAIRRYSYEDPGLPSHLGAIHQQDAGARPLRLIGRWRYDARGRVVEHANAEGHVLTMRYDVDADVDAAAQAGEIVNELTNETGATTRYRYRNVDGRWRAVAIDGPGCPQCSPGQRAFQYASNGALQSVTTGAMRQFRDSQGRVVRIERIDSVGTRGSNAAVLLWRFEYADDVARLPALIARPSVEPGHEHRYVIRYADAGVLRGKPIEVAESGYSAGRPVVRTLTFTYDAAGRPATGASPMDAARTRVLALLVSAVTQKGMAEAFDSLSAFERMRRLPGVTTTRGGFIYRAANGARFSHEADDFGRLVRSESADAGVETFEYDDADRVVRQADGTGATVALTYDDAGRRLSRTVRTPAGFEETTRYHYEGGRLVRVEHPVADEINRYDSQGRLVERTVVIHVGKTPQRLTSQFEYEGTGRQPVARHLPDGTRLLFDRAGETQDGRRAPGVRWQTNRWLAARAIIDGGDDWRYGNGIHRVVTRDRNGRVTALRHQKAGAAAASLQEAVLARQLHYDAKGRIQRMEAWPPSGNALMASRATSSSQIAPSTSPTASDVMAITDYAYDASGRLIVAQAPEGPWWYAWDANGNRLGEKRPDAVAKETRAAAARTGPPAGAGHQYSVGSNRMQGPAYDAVGRPASWNGLQLIWHPGGQLARIESAGRVVARYFYNHRGERVAKQVGDDWTHFAYEEGRLVAEWGHGVDGLQWTVQRGGLPVAVLSLKTRQITFLHHDHIGTPIAATDERGLIVWRAGHGPFGEPHGPPPPSRLRLPGQYFDAESGLHYNLHRYYDPATGRYLTPDPLGLRSGPNSYLYAAGNPIRYSDPTGLLLFAFDGTHNTADDLTNVRLFMEMYRYQSGDPAGLGEEFRRYQTGVGVRDDGSRSDWDAAFATDWRKAVDKQIDNFMRAVNALQPGEQLFIDVVGFSRGAVQARVFGQEIARVLRQRTVPNADQVVLRFMGLFDSVSTSMFRGHSVEAVQCATAIAPEWQQVTHLLALDERRGHFTPLSILGPEPAGAPSGARREIVLLGAHSDVGGGYVGDRVRPSRQGDLSDVALWVMLEQARQAGVELSALSSAQAVVSQPIIHDETAESQLRPHTRLVQRGGQQAFIDAMGLEGMDPILAARLVTPLPPPTAPGRPDIVLTHPRTIAGSVDMERYCVWLLASDYLRSCPAAP